MDAQTLVAAGVVAAAARFLLARARRAWAAARPSKEPGCGGGCGCDG